MALGSKTKAAVPAVEFKGGEETAIASVPETVPESVPETAAETETAETAETAEPADVWDSLPAATARPDVVVTGTGPKRLDVEKDTPARIKGGVMESYRLYQAAQVEGASQNEVNKGVKAAWRWQPVPSEDIGQQFVKLARRYCLGREERLTFRGKVIKHPKTGELGVTFLAKTFEARDNA